MFIGALIGWFIGLVLCLWQIINVMKYVDWYNSNPINKALNRRIRIKLNWPVRCVFVLACIVGGAIIGHFVS